MPSKIQNISDLHRTFLDLATRRTTPVVTYRATAARGDPSTRGTGFFLEHGERAYVVTNTHVLEEYAAGRAADRDVRVQVWSGEGQTGSEIHGGYLIVPNDKSSVALGVHSIYDHRDIGLIELTPEAARLARQEKEFVRFEDLRVDLPAPGTAVFYKGYPAKSAEFHGPIQKALFGQWLDVREVDQASLAIVVTGPPLAVYRSDEFPDEDGKDLKGISGSALMAAEDGRVVGVVWGSLDRTVASPVYAVPAATLRDLVSKYEEIQSRRIGEQKSG